MIQYSIFPAYTPPEKDATYIEMNYNGHHILACQTENGYILERIYSTDPTDYLALNLMPGTKLEDKLINKIIQ